jgi:hypothetical protein
MPLEDNESFKRELKTWLFRKVYGEERFNSMGSGKRFISVTYYYYYYYVFGLEVEFPTLWIELHSFGKCPCFFELGLMHLLSGSPCFHLHAWFIERKRISHISKCVILTVLVSPSPLILQTKPFKKSWMLILWLP